MASKKPTKKVVAKKPTTTKKVATKAPARVVTPKKGKSKNAGIIGIALIVLALIISVGTYAYYRTTVTGNIEGSILAWECTADDEANNFALNLGDLYPGKTGSWPITLSVRNFEATFTISMNTPVNVDNLTFTHGNTQLCSGGSCSGESTVVVDGTATGSASATATINYEWPLGGPQTTNIPVTNTASSVIVNIVCTQNNKTPFTPTPAA